MRASTIERVHASLARRHARERRFRRLGLTAIACGLGLVAMLFADIIGKGYGGFVQTEIRLTIHFDPRILDPDGKHDPARLSGANYAALIKAALRATFPAVSTRRDRRRLYRIISSGAPFALRERVLADPAIIGDTQALWLVADDDIDMLVKGHIDRDAARDKRHAKGQAKDQVVGWLEQLEQQGAVRKRFNTGFFTHGDSREPEQAGIAGAVMGSLYTLLVTLLLAFPLGVATAVYLEEYAPTNRWTDLIEVNINNLAAVPSIVFGLLGLAVFINFFGLPRSAPLVGGLVLALMTLPTIIIASRAALKSVPPSIREAALGVGASKLQTITHHVLPLAMPGMLTGTIIGMAQALGESAPLLMIGMVAFIVDIPQGIFDPATVLPVQVYLWADSPERAFVERTSAAIMVLLAFLITMNLLAVVLRRRFERRW